MTAVAQAGAGARRFARYAGALERAGSDAFVLASEPAVQHATGLHLYTQRLIPQRPTVCVLAPPRPPVIVCVEYEIEQLATEFPELDVVTFAEVGDDPWRLVAALLAEAGARRVVVEDTIPAAWLEGLRRNLPGAEVQLSYELPALPRIVKDEHEIAVIEAGSLAAERAIAAGAEVAGEGVSEQVVARTIADAFRAELSTRASEVAGICIGPQHIDQMHHLAGPELLPARGPSRLGIVGRIDGYWILLTRMHALGDEPRYAEVHSAYVSAYEETLETLQPGASTSALYAECRERLAAAGFTLVSAKAGHGTGLDFRELPWISHAHDSELVAGTVLAYDFGTAAVGPYTLHIEDRVLIADDGPRRLSNLWDHADARGGYRAALGAVR
jgi:Xaa-Pro dipeptidase